MVRFITLVSFVILAVALVFAQSTPFELKLIASAPNHPLFVTHAKDGSRRLFYVEQAGRIMVLPPTSPTATVFLDIQSRVKSGGELGLLGLAFHPQFSSNRRFFVNYTRLDEATVISEFLSSALDPNTADPDSEVVLLVIPQPYQNHKGGMLAFGPAGYLYIGMGDGGSVYDPENRAQNIEELLGKILRIDVDTPGSDGAHYSSPSSNPFFGDTAGRDEIYAYGFRNPWRFSFDRQTGELYVGDVGQEAREEIDIVVPGGNYGWRVFEGTQCTGAGPAPCIPANYVAPLFEYSHVFGRCSITGGYVYRGMAGTFPAGTYVYADYCSGAIFALSNGTEDFLLHAPSVVSSLGEDESGEIYVVGYTSGIYRLVRKTRRQITSH